MLRYSVALLLLSIAVQAQTPSASPSVNQTPGKAQTTTHNAQQFHSEGERVFAQNCSRCHHAPEGFSPRISGTIARHMRVRAQLSEHDEQELLRFLNP